MWLEQPSDENSKQPYSIQIWMEGMLVNSEQESPSLNNVFGDDGQENLEAVLPRHSIKLNQ